jgi:fatty acid desaturase
MERAVNSFGIDSPSQPIPVALNLALFAIATLGATTLLWSASRAETRLALAAAAIAFSYVNNTLFSLLHEAVHGQFHPAPRLNDGFGRLAAGFFPTAYSMQRVFHLGHHQRNRSAVEQFDYLHPNDNKFFKYAQWYSILTGLYWCFVPLGCLVYLLAPGLLRAPILRSRQSKLAQQSSADAMFSDLDRAPAGWIRGEIFISAAIQFGLFYLLDLTLIGWCCCYGAFAINWSALQYADHAWSPLDRRDGAWNLRVNRVVQYLFLNYHHHLAHHQRPEVPWLYLPRYVDFSIERPGFLSVYFSMWRGPRRFPQDGEAAIHAAQPAARPWRAELTCLALNLRFMRRHWRYLVVFLLVYRYSLFRWRRTRAVRFAYALAQYVDDVLDGDYPVHEEPLEIVDDLIGQFQANLFTASAIGNLARCVHQEFSALRRDADDPIVELLQLFRIMRFDRERVRGGLLLSQRALDEQHWWTFFHSVNLLMIATGAELRAGDVSALVKAFGWCSTLRDLQEDIGRGLIGIPSEVIDAAQRQGAKSLRYSELTASPAVRRWIQELHARGKYHLRSCDEQLNSLGNRKGVKIARLFARSMNSFHSRYTKLHPEFFTTDCRIEIDNGMKQMSPRGIAGRGEPI